MLRSYQMISSLSIYAGSTYKYNFPWIAFTVWNSRKCSSSFSWCHFPLNPPFNCIHGSYSIHTLNEWGHFPYNKGIEFTTHRIKLSSSKWTDLAVVSGGDHVSGMLGEDYHLTKHWAGAGAGLTLCVTRAWPTSALRLMSLSQASSLQLFSYWSHFFFKLVHSKTLIGHSRIR